MSGKLAIDVVEFRPLHRSTLVGFATIAIPAMRLTIREVAIHQHRNGGRWAQLPARPQVKDGQLVRERDGKIAYATLMDFDTRAVRDAFSSAVVAALLARFPDVFDAQGSAA